MFLNDNIKADSVDTGSCLMKDVMSNYSDLVPPSSTYRARFMEAMALT